MFSIVQGYLIVEILKNTAATILILFIILMSNTLGRVLADVSDGEIPLDALFPVFLGQSIQVLSLLLPFGFFLGVIFAFGRLYKDHELVVLHACGYGYRQLISLSFNRDVSGIFIHSLVQPLVECRVLCKVQKTLLMKRRMYMNLNR